MPILLLAVEIPDGVVGIVASAAGVIMLLRYVPLERLEPATEAEGWELAETGDMAENFVQIETGDLDGE